LAEAYNNIGPQVTSDPNAKRTLVAMAGLETNDLILLTRTDGTVYPVVADCTDIVIRVSLEPDFNAEAGLDVQKGIIIDPGWYGDADGMAIMKQALNIQAYGNFWAHMWTAGEWTQAEQIPFEWAMVNRKAALLKQWDMGPINMRCMGMGPVAQAIGWKQTAGFPTSWDEIYQLYSSMTYNDAFGNGCKWWFPPYYNGGYDISDDATCNGIGARQLGNAASGPGYCAALRSRAAVLDSGLNQ
jgi:hypothetical protein